MVVHAAAAVAAAATRRALLLHRPRRGRRRGHRLAHHPRGRGAGDPRAGAGGVMAAEIRIPPLGESINEATLVRWLKEDGAHVEADEVVLELETEKAAMEVQAETSGRLSIVVPAGSRVHPGDVVGRITEAVTTERAAPVTAGRTGAPSEPSRSAE